MNSRAAIRSVALVLCGVLLACLVGEALIRIGTANQKNYVIEMWRYARLLKERSPDPRVGHQHRPNTTARLQGAQIDINALGMRGPMPDPRIPRARTVVILGDSVALGWGIAEEATLRAQLARALGRQVQVLNAGIGDMNLAQIVALWEHLRPNVHAGTIIVLATPRATAPRTPDSGNWLVEHSQLAALGMTFVRQFGSGDVGREATTAAYRRAWSDGPGLAGMNAALDRLKSVEAADGTHVLVALVPEMRDTNHYGMQFMTDRLAAETARRGWPFVDLLPALRDAPSAALWVSVQDPHPNGEAFRRMAAQLAPRVREMMQSAGPCPGGRTAASATCR